MRTAELTGALLDYWVARAEGVKWPAIHEHEGRPDWCALGGNPHRVYAPSTDWAQGGPIIDRERMTFATHGTGPRGENGFEPVVAITYTGMRAMDGPNHLVAAMRAYVASKFGDEVEDAP